jgi:hypothetical protein
MTISRMTLMFMLNAIISVLKVSLMLGDTIKPVMQSVIMLSGIMLNVLAPCEHALKHQLSSSSCKDRSLRKLKKIHIVLWSKF